MNRQYIEAQHVLTRYLAGQLSDAEREAFETHYVEHPETLRELEVAAKLKLGLTLLQDSGELAAPRRFYWQRGLAAAALLFIVVAVASWFMTHTPAPPLLAASVNALGESRQVPLPADIYTIERTRSRGFDASFQLPATSRAICLRVLPENPSATAYRLQLNAVAADAAPRTIASLRSLRVDADGFVTVYASSERLQPGNYELILSADSGRGAGSAAVSSFLIQIAPANTVVSSRK